MDAIQMVDLKGQYARIRDEVNLALQEVLDSAAFIQGKAVQDFASALSQYLGVKNTIPCGNGTDALQITMMAMGLAPGDEIITTSFNYIAVAEVAALLRLKPVLVDVDPQTFCMDPKALAAAISPNTKAVVPVHFYGHSAPMEPILDIARKHNLWVIEDNAQAMGAEYRFADGHTCKTGTMGHAGCTSFFPSKNLGAYGDGGAITTHDDTLAEKMRMITRHGQRERYYHELVGCNSRLDTLQASVLLVKLKHLAEYTEARRAAAAYYDAALGNHPAITIPFQAPYCRHVYHQYTLKVEGGKRDALKAHLAKQGIPSMVYYPLPVHRQPMFANLGGEHYDLPVTEWLTGRVLSLPMHTELTRVQQDRIIGAIVEFMD